MSGEKLQVFLCHASGDKAEVRALYRRLKAENWLYSWLDEEELLAGQNWEREITLAVKTSDAVIVCLTQKAVSEAGFRHKEITFALDKADEQPEGQIFVIPIKLEACQLPERLHHLHAIDYFEERGHERLLRALRVRAEKQGIKVELTATPKPVETEQERLLRELEDPRTTHERRRDIGDRLNVIGDTRPGVGVRGEDGTPDIEWLPVAPGGKLIIENKTYTVPPFYIARYAITYAQYAAFVEAGDGFDNPAWWKGMPKEYQKQKLEEQRTKSWNNPRDTVSWYQNVAFARWLNHRLKGLRLPNPGDLSDQPIVIGQSVHVRLPLEWEWQWAAQGGREQREYPWGEWKEGYANTREAGLERAIAVGMYPQGAALCGALDMSGNLWEWCWNKYSKEFPFRMLRGGSFLVYQIAAACAYRDRNLPYVVNLEYGFRVVVSPTAPSEL